MKWFTYWGAAVHINGRQQSQGCTWNRLTRWHGEIIWLYFVIPPPLYKWKGFAAPSAVGAFLYGVLFVDLVLDRRLLYRFVVFLHQPSFFGILTVHCGSRGSSQPQIPIQGTHTGIFGFQDEFNMEEHWLSNPTIFTAEMATNRWILILRATKRCDSTLQSYSWNCSNIEPDSNEFTLTTYLL